MASTSSIYSIIYKIIPHISKKHAALIKDCILDGNKKKYALVLLLERIDSVIKPYRKFERSETRQNWICGQIIKYFEIQRIAIPRSIIDIGGGNGNVLNVFATKYNLPKEDCICIEKSAESTLEPSSDATTTINNEFQYDFSHADRVQYVFLTNKKKEKEQEQEDKSEQKIKQVDAIFCMVSLHHMTDLYISDVILPLIQTKLKPGGYLLLKEHNAATAETRMLIEWEHHLYYLMERAGKRTTDELQHYATTSTANYKSRETYQQMMEERCGCECIRTLNNVFEAGQLDTTASKLYWQIFRKL
jgi:SAM-dependent methyltransferase